MTDDKHVLPGRFFKAVSCLLLVVFICTLSPLATASRNVISPDLKISPEYHYFWLETELFPEKGGWSVDSQFFPSVGSTYLLAAGLGNPVADAGTSFNVSRSGRYAVWVRSKNWLPKFNPGRFRVVIDDTLISRECGRFPHKQWAWEKVGIFDLPTGAHTLALRDLTGAYGRCDVVLLTDDLEFIPPASREEIAGLRQYFLSPAVRAASIQDYQVVVIGGGIGGVCAALAAGREGCRVALIQNRPVLGGNASSEIGVGPSGAYAGGHHPYHLETGILRELSRSRIPRRGWDEVLLEAVGEEKNIACFLNTQATKALVGPPGHIQAVEAVNLITGKPYRFRGKIFLDCTGDGDVAVSADAEYRHGRESRDEFGESLAPSVEDRRTMGTALMFQSAAAPGETVFQRPAWAYHFPTVADIPHRIFTGETSGFWWLSYGGTLDTVAQAEEIRDELLRVIYGVWDFIKNHSPLTRDSCRNRSLGWVGFVAGKRESRRLIGDYILTQNDLEASTSFPDRVAYGGWPIDLHTPKGIFDPGFPNLQHSVEPYSIPFRSLYSRNVDNLMFAGRHISASHVALGSTRVLATIAACGQAIGTAASLCLEYGLTPRQLGERKISELQQRILKNDGRILGLKNLDPEDLARAARVTASSFAPALPCTAESTVPSGSSHPLNYFRAMMFPAPGEKIDRVSVLVRSENEEDVRLTLGLRKAPAWGIGRNIQSLSREPDLAVVTAAAPPGGPHWVTFPVGAAVRPGEYYWVYLRKAPGVSWLLTDHGLPWSYRGYLTGSWEYAGIRQGLYCLVLDPPLNYEGTAPENVINGLKWPEEWSFNLWASDPKQSLPQWLELEFDGEVEFNQVLLTFDTGFTPPTSSLPRSPHCVRSYSIQVSGPEGWKTLASVEDNRHRFRSHTFETVKTDRLRILVTGTNGDASARIYEVRVYQDASLSRWE